ncbi:MAG: sulfatase-like hydrolase/transferase, partial [Myxococcota bacterium]
MRGLPAVCLSVSLLLAACSGGAPPHDVVIFMIDTLRADHVGAYGYARETTPNIDAFAAEGVLFERAYAPAPWTLPSVVSLMTSTFPCEHGVVLDGQQISPALVPLAEHLRMRGFATASFHANSYAGAISGLDRGFDVSEARDYTDGERVGGWLDEVGPDRPVFLYVHNIEPHTPYKAPSAEAERFAPVTVLARHDVNRLLGRFQGLGRVDWSKGRAPGTTEVS